jgi:hypothetical protein
MIVAAQSFAKVQFYRTQQLVVFVCCSFTRTPGHTGVWTTEEDIKLKDAVQMHDGKNWHAIAVLVPGRTKMQCSGR